MYSFEGYGHIVLLLLIAGVILMIYRYFAGKRNEDEQKHTHADF